MGLRAHQINNWGCWELQEERDQREKGVPHKDNWMLTDPMRSAEIAPDFRSIHGPYCISCLKWVHIYINSKKRLRCDTSEKGSKTREHGWSTRHHAGHCTHCRKDCMSGAHPCLDPLARPNIYLLRGSALAIHQAWLISLHFSCPATKWIAFFMTSALQINSMN